MVDLYSSLPSQLAELLREDEQVSSSQGQQQSVVRERFGQAVQTVPWKSQNFGELVPPLTALTAERLDEHSWIRVAESPLRVSLYRALSTFMFERLGIAYWPDLAQFSIMDFQSELSERSLTVLAEMLFDRVASAAQPVAPAVAPILMNFHSVKEAAAEVLAQFDDRQRYIMSERLFVRNPRTLASIAEELDITRERVRQIEAKAVKKLKAQLKMHHLADKLQTAADSFRNEMGAVFADSHARVDGFLHNILGEGPDEQHRELLIWLAGPYRFEKGYWYHPELWRPDELDQALERLLDSGQRDHESVFRTYAQFQVRRDFADSLIELNSKINRISNTYFWGRPTWANRTIALLTEHGEPMTLEEIAEVLEAGPDPRGLRNALANSDDVIKVDTRRYGLPEWGGAEYTGVSDAISAEIEAREGLANFAELVAVVTEQTGARESTVRLYGQAPRFVLSDGNIRLRRDNEPFRPNAERLLTRRTVFRFQDRTSIRFSLSSEDFRGSGRALPDDIAFHLGAQLDQRIVYSGYGMELPITRPSSMPENGSLGSLRELSLFLGAEAGDELRVDFQLANRTFEAAVVKEPALEDLEALEQLRLLTGASSLTLAEVLDELDAALDYPLAGIGAVLRVRGDEDVLAALSKSASVWQ